MNQHDQMREALQLALDALIQAGTKDEDDYRRQGNAIKHIQEALSAEPAPLVRLTDEEISLLDKQYLDIEPSGLQVRDFANAIMDAMIAKNRGRK